MILQHSSFKNPENPNQKIWRYVDLTKFLELLNSKSLYFTRLDKFDDIFEGSVPIKTAQTRTIPKRVVIQEVLVNGEKISSSEVTLDNPEDYIENQKKEREKFAVNCWHMNDFESAAMWKLYLKSNEGIAIQSNFKKLKKILTKSRFQFFIGTVNYIDYENDKLEFDNSFLPFVHKRKSFSHENELRAIIPIEAPKNSGKIDLSEGGWKIKINLNELIENIYISPESPEWMTKLIADTCQKFGYGFNIINSRMNDKPIY